jgi:hypothetical protein
MLVSNNIEIDPSLKLIRIAYNSKLFRQRPSALGQKKI